MKISDHDKEEAVRWANQQADYILSLEDRLDHMCQQVRDLRCYLDRIRISQSVDADAAKFRKSVEHIMEDYE